MNYNVFFHPLAEKELNSLNKSVKLIVLKQINKISQSPYLGEMLGNKAGLDLTGYRKIYADNKRIRIVYEIIEDDLIVYIIAIGKRDDMEVYKSAFKRIK